LKPASGWFVRKGQGGQISMSARTKKSSLWASLASYGLILEALVGISDRAFAHASSATTLAVNDPACIASYAGQCVVRTEHGALEMKVSENGQMTAVFSAAVSAPPNQPSGSGEGGVLTAGNNADSESAPSHATVPSSVLEPLVTLQIEDDLELQVQNGQITEEDAAQIATDVARLDGIIYQVPDLEKIEVDLGLPPEAQDQDLDQTVAQQDFEELVCAHLQITLGVGPQTAFYLADRLGVQVVALAMPSINSTLPMPSRN